MGVGGGWQGGRAASTWLYDILEGPKCRNIIPYRTLLTPCLINMQQIFSCYVKVYVEETKYGKLHWVR